MSAVPARRQAIPSAASPRPRGGADSDDDGLADGAEVTMHGTSPSDADSADDGLSDGAELGTHGTDPLLADWSA